jgi:hypothetical protein
MLKIIISKETSQIAVVTGSDNLNNIRCEASRNFRSEKREYLKDKFNEFAVNSKNKNIKALYRGINKLNRGYQPS